MAHQLEVLQLLERLNREEGRTILMVLHDLKNAARFSHHMIALSEGKVAAAGPPEAVMTGELLREVFSVEAETFPDPRTGIPLCVPYGVRGPDSESGESSVETGFTQLSGDGL